MVVTAIKRLTLLLLITFLSNKSLNNIALLGAPDIKLIKKTYNFRLDLNKLIIKEVFNSFIIIEDINKIGNISLIKTKEVFITDIFTLSPYIKTTKNNNIKRTLDIYLTILLFINNPYFVIIN